ncbi:cyanophycinase [Exiguobacterium sp. SH31]|uniref:Type 1 glutamine amidotransferase-like domain-containing protein n=1 Tax=unclassified Exiguobacterium TaxID=2644629 RepID=UPI0008AE4498|nr:MULTISPECIES: Type 1 glutamine amidotransferase-like domain-containing protein [unclassified Exiguobacterium]OGX80639.1 cyanophycinase [Exiguobacterium sp. SH31]TCI69852.1 cyanophycinase [Exiguobacterium sp. SH0S7]
MTTYYYLGWFSHYFPQRLARAISQDIVTRDSLVLISSNPASAEVNGTTELSWLKEANILFNEYHLINYEMNQTKAKRLIDEASVIFLLGGDTVKQNMFLHEYSLFEQVHTSEGVILGASAGAINMSSKWLCSPNFGYEVASPIIYRGLALHNFSVLSHFDLENNMDVVKQELALLSTELPVYVSNKDCAIRVQENRIDIFGDVFLYAYRNMTKLTETI